MSGTGNRTYIDRYHSYSRAMQARYRVARARQEIQDAFPDDGRRDIPHVAAAFEALEETMQSLKRLADIFDGNGSHYVEDFMPDETGFTANDRQMRPGCDKPWFDTTTTTTKEN